MNPFVKYAPKVSRSSFKKRTKATTEFSMRDWQSECAKQLRGIRFANVSAPCGAGKTVALTLLATQELHDSHLKQKQLIITPQKVIGAAFIDTRPITIDGTTYIWSPNLNNLVEYRNKSVLRALRRWLLSDSSVLLRNVVDKRKLDEVIAVTSHQALARVWRKMTSAQRTLALKNCTITVDESHHIAGVFDENGTAELTDEEREESNHLGTVIQAAVHAGKSTHVRLATATFYRGDAQPILDKTIAAEFAKGTYILSWIRHWDGLGLESFRIDYRFYNKDVTEPITTVLKQMKDDLNHHFMVFVPASNIAWRKDNSSRFLLLMKSLRRIFGEDAVLDLVTQGSVQAANVKRLRADVVNIKADNKPTFRVIASCGIGLEGMDYVPVDRLINLGVQNSIVRAIQVMGRPMRKFAGKTKVSITNYVPTPCQPTDGNSIPEALADRTNAILVCLAWDDITHPIIVELMRLTPKKEWKRKATLLTEALGSQYSSVLEKAAVAVERLDKKTSAAIKEALAIVLDKAGIRADAMLIQGLEVAMRRAQLMAHKNPRAQHLSNLFDVSMLRSKLGFNILKKYRLEDQTIFFGDCSKAVLEQAKRAIKQLEGLDEFATFKKEWMRFNP